MAGAVAGRLIVIGDIHGCWEELERLLAMARPAADDRIIAVGDLVAKGPSTRRVLHIARELPNLRCVRGNHEAVLLEAWQRGQLHRIDSPAHRQAVEDMGADAEALMAWMATWPLYLELPECVVVHAGLRPGVALEKQQEQDLLSLRTLDSDDTPWFEAYTDERLIVHGHWAAQGLVMRSNVIGLDTGCVYGGSLSAVVLPERRLISVPAKRAYVPIDRAATGDESMSV